MHAYQTEETVDAYYQFTVPAGSSTLEHRAEIAALATKVHPEVTGRAEAAARLAGVDVQWVCADISAGPADVTSYELVSVHYPALKRSPDDHAVHALLNAVAPGGTLLVVGHAPLDPKYARAHGFDLADYVQVADVKAAFGDGWHVAVDETRPRVDPLQEGSPYTHDAVIRAQRHGGPAVP